MFLDEMIFLAEEEDFFFLNERFCVYKRTYHLFEEKLLNVN